MTGAWGRALRAKNSMSAFLSLRLAGEPMIPDRLGHDFSKYQNIIKEIRKTQYSHSGIVFLPDGRKYVLVLLSIDLVDFVDGTGLLQNISKMIYEYMMEN